MCVAGSALLAALSGAVNADDAGGDARELLERMVRASQTIDYVGTFVYRSGSTIQSMKIIHRADGEGSRERLVALSGAAREVIRDGQQVTCILPDDRAVVVATRRSGTAGSSTVFGSALAIDPDIGEYYFISTNGVERVANREATVIDVRPKDRYRYGFRFAVERHSGLLLKSQLIDENRTTLEEIVYTHLDLPESIPDEALEPEISHAGFILYGSLDVAGSEGDDSQRTHEWTVGWLPPGFRMTSDSRSPVRNDRDSMEHRVYSDGLVSISVFIERRLDAPDQLGGLYSVGAVNAYSRTVDDFQVSVVGEVPGITAVKVAASIMKR